MYKKLVYIFIFLFVYVSGAQSKSFERTLDSILKLRKLSIDTNLDADQRIAFALKANELSYQTQIDTTILKSTRRVAWVYLDLEDHPKIIKWSHKCLKLAQKIRDSSVMALMNYYLGWSYSEQENYNDSTYYYFYKASKIYQKLKEIKNEADVLYNIAYLHEDAKDYIRADQNVFEAIKLIKSLPSDEENLTTLYELYNLTGILSARITNYQEALEYFNEAIKINKRRHDNHIDHILPLINMAGVYDKQKKFKKANTIYNNLLKQKHTYSKSDYATILSNLAYSKFLSSDSDNNEIKSLFKRAYHISDSLDEFQSLGVCGNDFSEFYLSLGQKDSALPYLTRSLELSKQIKENAEALRSLKLLAQATDGETGKAYLYDYIALNDSLIANERAARNKFARIQFEIDEITQERDKATKQRSLLFGASISLVAVLLLVMLAFYQRSKNKQLRFDKAQQQANENIYSLMLKQQSTLEQGRTQERYRISEELHDGILGKLFGTRMGLGLLSKSISASDNDLDKYNSFINSMQAIETDIRNVSHVLKDESLTTAVDFVAIIEHYIKDVCDLHRLEYTLYANPEIDWTSINDHIKVNLYRVLQESMQNIIKHAKADTVDVSFYLIDNQLQLSVKDNGIGFNTKQQHKGIGLKNIKSRILKLSGSFSITSNANKGAIINVSVPI